MNKKSFAKRLRKDLTPAERILWSKLRNFQLEGKKFRRQQVIDHYIVDFVSFETRLIIEIDGGQHNSEEGIQKDLSRSQYLEKQGFRIIRFWNDDVIFRTDTVLEEIQRYITPSP